MLYDERDLIEEFHHLGELAAVLLRRGGDEILYRIVGESLVERKRFPLRPELVELFAARDADCATLDERGSDAHDPDRPVR